MSRQPKWMQHQAPDPAIPTRWLDTVWAIVMPGDKGLVYGTLAVTRKEAWRLLEDRECLGTAYTAEYCRAQGYRARRVQIWRELP